jgi:hypothetical protein
MTLQYIHDNLLYDLVIDGCIKYHGNVDYVTSHLNDGTSNTMDISDRQSPKLMEFVKNYKKAKKKNPSLTVEQFYNQRRAI